MIILHEGGYTVTRNITFTLWTKKTSTWGERRGEKTHPD